MRIFISAEDDPGKKRQVSTPTPTTAAESSNPRTSEPHTSLPKLPDKKKSDERPSKEVPEERTAAQMRPTKEPGLNNGIQWQQNQLMNRQ